MDLKNYIRDIPDFPKEGIIFKDITPLLLDKEAFEQTINQFYEKYKDADIDAVLGIESRGFIFGAALAFKLGCGFIPARKEGKLPHITIKEEYSLEYGTAAVEIHKDSIKQDQKILIIDDVVATGGTALACSKLVEVLGGKIVGIALLMELTFLDGMQKLKDYDVFSLIQY